jgi:adenine modification enzyme
MKAHQRLVRELRAKLPDPLLKEKRKLASDFSQARVEQISYDVAKNVILRNEYLGSMGSASHCFGLYFGEYLASVVCFGSTAGTKVAESVCGPQHADKVIVLVRGATEHWAHEHTASYLIPRACDLMAAKGKPIIVAYSDPAGGEVGTIYQACNFRYTGMTSGSQRYRDPDGKVHNTRQIHGLTRDRRNGGLNYTRTRAEQRRLLVEQGCTFEKEGGKHRYVFFAGDRRTKRLLRNALRWKVITEHPRRGNNAESDEAVDELAKGGDATLRTNRDWSGVAGIATDEEQSTARATEKPDGVSNIYCDDSSMAERPVQLGDGGSIPTSSLHFVPIPKTLATELVVNNHYLHRKPIISSWETIRWKPRRVRDHRGRIKVVVGDKKSKKALCWGIERDGQIVGVCTFGAPMWSVSAGVTGGAYWDVKLGYGRWYDCLELTRLWVDDSVTEHCIESKFVAWCVREIKKINPNAVIVAYADSAAGHRGVIYQALEFIYCGLSVPWTDKTVAGKDHRSVSKKMQGEKIGNRRSWAGVNVERKKRSRKHRYVKFLNPKDEGLLAWKREPNPRQAACLSPDLA